MSAPGPFMGEMNVPDERGLKLLDLEHVGVLAAEQAR